MKSIKDQKSPEWISTSRKRQQKLGLEAAFTKFVLSMSDLQILTGISILISGFAQLLCGLSCWHWQLLVYLAWFSSLTHLACLTFLRNYLYDNPGERSWRLVSMGILATLLVFALVPTGNYDWVSGFDLDADVYDDDDEPPLPPDYAICHIKKTKTADSLTFASMIVSVLLVAIGFVSRVIRLHKMLSSNAWKDAKLD
ncbi:MAG: hypothetical protein M1822_000298 [Bathelium mastoideum]|nr:MAG: hypothetical protein M1822_000298 [Bathelium mastoideum]